MSGITDEDSARVRDLFFDAAVEGSTWNSALDALTKLFDGFGATLVVMDKVLGAPSSVWVGGGFDPHGIELYAAHYGRLDPAWPIVGGQTPLGQIGSCTRFITPEFVRGSEFYQDFLIPQGGRYLTGGRLFEDDAEIVGMSVHSGEQRGPLGGQEIDRFRAIWPSLMTSMRVWRKLARARYEATANRLRGMLAAFEHISCGAVLVDKNSRLLATNLRAEQYLKKYFRFEAGRIVPSNQASAADFDRQIRFGLGQRRDARENSTVRIFGPQGKSILAFFMPLLSVQDYGYSTPTVIILLVDPYESLSMPPSVFSEAFGLTPREARIASIIGTGCTLENAAAEMGITYESARSYLKSVFQKLGIKKQTELVLFATRLAMVKGATAVDDKKLPPQK